MRDPHFKRSRTAIWLAASTIFCSLGSAASIFAQAQHGSEPHTAAAVIADDENWSKAETSGDMDYVNNLLLPDYRSISSNGNTHDKAAILAHTSKGKAPTPEDVAKQKEWRVAHPYLPMVEMDGDVAILTFVLDKGADPKQVMSCDIFVYREGRWRAIYSQHSEAGK